ncbi:peptidase M23 [Tepiditoga spiralis]|uniref:Peptidase M23 n=1 Tax=Tepiditoga spiralis TaxID=2108365 RepID=A0A7G1G8K6_9BACT|nr:M23 family metallopeptidase [Tepiditoga spiralis]BBE31287.1 peptidase M23 [Tepiditoga spiralis]
MKKIILLMFIVIVSVFVFSEIFMVPIKGSYITSSFGEYRNTGNNPHFHLGVDFSTFNRENIDVYASAQGNLYKIWINDPVYGNTIFLKHDDLSLITDYAHLNSFSEKINKYVDIIKKEFGDKKRMEIVFPDNSVNIKTGEIIALSGSTGEAEAPHLHFEVREEINGTEMIRNPLEYLEYKENRKKTLELLSVRVNGKYIDINNSDLNTIEFSGDYPKIDVRVRERLGNNTVIMVKSVSISLDNSLMYKIDFSSLPESVGYKPQPVYGYGSTSSIYWLKMYSIESLYPIKDNNWSQLIGSDKSSYKGEIVLEDFWGNKKVYNFNFIKN